MSQPPSRYPGKMRVSALAKQLGIPSRELIEKLNSMGEYVKTASSTLDQTVVRRIIQATAGSSESSAPGVSTAARSRPSRPGAMSDQENTAAPASNRPPQTTSVGDVGALVELAFEAARASGREDWYEMTVPVLKNRLLDITNRRFNEREHGVANMVEFVLALPDLLELVPSTPHPRARLRHRDQIADESGATSGGPPSPALEFSRHTGPERVRHDLWRAAIDYRSERAYVWDQELQTARVGEPGPTAIAFPTISEEEVHRWRSAYFEQYRKDLSSSELHRVIEWMASDLATVALPARLRGPWNGFYRNRVLEHVRAFFDSKGLPVPADLTTTPTVPIADTHARDANQLREYLHRCLDQMTFEELRQLQVPAWVAWNAVEPRR